MAGHPLRSATDRRFGRPLPCQLANQTRVHLIPPEFFTPDHVILCAYAVLAVVSNCYPPVWGRLPTRYSPVRHSVTKDFIRRICPKCFVRLACVKHAASVHPERGSNSHVWVFSLQLCCLVKTNFVLLSEVFSSLVKGSILVKLNLANSFIQIESEFTVLKVFNFHWSVLIDSQNLSRFLTVQLSMFFVCSLATAWLFYQITVRLSSTFLFFWTLF